MDALEWKGTTSSAAPKASLADALFTRTQQRLLALLFGQPARTFYATELIGLTGAGSGAVQRELARLAQSGLVTVRLGHRAADEQPEALSSVRLIWRPQAAESMLARVSRVSWVSTI